MSEKNEIQNERDKEAPEDKPKETYRKIDMRVGRRKETTEAVPETDVARQAAAAQEDSTQAEEASADFSGPDEHASAPSATAEAPKGEEAQEAQDAPETLNMYDLLRMMLGMCVQQAWIHLGIQLAPGAKELKMDLPQARLAIDTVAYIKEALAAQLQEAEKREIEQILATLRLNYVQRA